jgi:hypothetical protein
MVLIKKYTNILMVLVIVLIGVTNYAWGERIWVNDGFGWDGVFYADIKKDWFNKVFIEKRYKVSANVYMPVDKYRLQRILPSGILHYTLRIFHVPMEDKNIVKGFLLYNLFLLSIMAYTWGLIADLLEISIKGKWLGFIGLFINSALAFNLWYPNLTDVTAFAIGIIMLYYYFNNTAIGILILSFLGAFTWPTLSYTGFFLYIFPKDNTYYQPARFKLNIYISILISCLVLFGALYLRFVLNFTKGVQLPSALFLSIILLIGYMFWGLNSILNDNKLYDFNYIKSNINLKRLIIFTLLFALMKILISFAGYKVEVLILSFFIKNILAFCIAMPGAKFFLRNILSTCIAMPFSFGLGHILYYGPIVLLCFFSWKLICKTIHKNGIGLTFVFLQVLILGLGSESRQIINYYPFILLFTIKATEQYKWKTSYYWFLSVLSFLYSRLWLKFNTGPMNDRVILKSGTWRVISPRDFPLQRIFSTFGNRMINEMYVIQGSLVIITGVILYFLLLNNKKPKNETVVLTCPPKKVPH